MLTLANVAREDQPRKSAHDTARLSTVPRDFDSPAASGSRHREGSSALLQAALDAAGHDSPVGQLARAIAEYQRENADHQRENAKKENVASLGTAAIAGMFRRAVLVVALIAPASWHVLDLLSGTLMPGSQGDTLRKIETTQNALVQFVVGCEVARRDGTPLPDVPASLSLVQIQRLAAAEAERDTLIGN